MALLEQGRADATLNDKDSAESYLAEHPEAKVKIVLTVPGDPVTVPMKKALLIYLINAIMVFV